MKQHEVSLETLAGGAAPPRFDRELRKVVHNIMDPNTDPEAKRSITLTVTFSPTESRTSLGAKIEVKTKLAPPKPVDTAVHIGEMGGKPVMIGYDPRQRSLFSEDQDPDITPMPENATQAQEE